MKPLHNTHASAKGSYDNIFMNGQEVFKFAVRAVPSVRCLPASLTLLACVQGKRGNFLWRTWLCAVNAYLRS